MQDNGIIGASGEVNVVASPLVKSKVVADLEIDDPSAEVAKAALIKNTIRSEDDGGTDGGDGDTDNK